MDKFHVKSSTLQKYDGKSMKYISFPKNYVDYMSIDIDIDTKTDTDTDTDYEKNYKINKHRSKRDPVYYDIDKYHSIKCEKKEFSREMTLCENIKYDISHHIFNEHTSFTINCDDNQQKKICIYINDLLYTFSEEIKILKMKYNDSKDAFNSIVFRVFRNDSKISTDELKLIMIVKNVKKTIIYDDLPIYVTYKYVDTSDKYSKLKNFNCLTYKIQKSCYEREDENKHENKRKKHKNFNKNKNTKGSSECKQFIIHNYDS